MKTKITLLALSTLLISICTAQKTTKISIFKNGTAFFHKSETVETKNHEYILKAPPEALMGTLWFSSGNDKIKSVKRISGIEIKKEEANSMEDLLKANINKRVRLIPYQGEPYEATVIRMNDNIISLKAKDRWISTTTSQIRTIEFFEEPSWQIDSENEHPQLCIGFENDGKKNLSMFYMQGNMGWLPSYLIELKGKQAHITLQAALVNDAEDIENADIEFVVGVPNFKFNSITSPLGSSMTISQIISTLTSAGSISQFAGSIDNNLLSNSIMTQQIAPAVTTSVNLQGINFFQAEVESQEDLYFYKQKNVTLKKGERAILDLMSSEIPFEHLYEVEIPSNNTGYYYSYSTSNDENPHKVWHSIKLMNNTGMPLTTGTAMIVKNENGIKSPISQDILKYTPMSGSSNIKITVSPDILVTDNEQESGRQEKAKKYSNAYYDMVTIESTIKVKNYKKENVTLSVSRNINGKLLKSDHPWTIEKKASYNYYNNVNPSNDVEWSVNLKPGEEKDISYSYSMYVYR